MGDIWDVAGGRASCVSVGAEAVDMPVNCIVRGVGMAVGGAIGTRSLVRVCKGRRQISETGLRGRVGKNARIVVVCNLNDVRVHGLFVSDISVWCGMRTGYRVFEMGGSCSSRMPVTGQIGILGPGSIIRSRSWECIR